MSISKSFNKKNNTYYVYDTQYVWCEEKRKKVRVRKCIGKLAEDGTIIPTRKKKVSAVDTNSEACSDTMAQLCGAIVNGIDVVCDTLTGIKINLLSIRKQIASN